MSAYKETPTIKPMTYSCDRTSSLQAGEDELLVSPQDPKYTAQHPFKRSSRLLTFGKLVFSALAIAIVVTRVDLPSAWYRIQQQSVWLALVAGAALMGQIMLGGLRWHVILQRLGGRMRLRTSVALFYVAVFFNATLWGAIAGDFVRVWLAHKNAVEMKTAVNSVLIDRVAPVCAVALLMLVTLPIFAARVGISAAVMPFVLSLSILVGILLVTKLDRLPAIWRGNRIVCSLQLLGKITRSVFLTPSTAVRVVCIAIGAQILSAISAYVIAKSLAVDIGPLDCLILMQPVALVTALPISIGGWGTREATVVMLFAFVGVSSEAALALSVQIGIINLLVSLPGGIMWLFLGARRDKPAMQQSFGSESGNNGCAAFNSKN